MLDSGVAVQQRVVLGSLWRKKREVNAGPWACVWLQHGEREREEGEQSRWMDREKTKEKRCCQKGMAMWIRSTEAARWGFLMSFFKNMY